MALTQPTPSKTAQAAPLVPQADTKIRNEMRGEIRGHLGSSRAAAVSSDSALRRSSSGYGLPCANCRLYYPASLDACPCCKSTERIAAEVAPAIPKPPAVAAAEPIVDVLALEQEREAFLQQFKSQLVAADAQIASTPANCTLSGQHDENTEPASICRPCYDQLQERIDVLEAALHIDLKEAAQIVYDAVWADPSDPSKTYANAAAALLAELRKRSGVSSLLGPFQPLGN
jgi:hypothetical protein